jgi:hypothetical protein
MKKKEILKMWIENAPSNTDSKFFRKYSKESLNQLYAWLTVKNRFFHEFFFTTGEPKPLEWFITTDAILNFKKNKEAWWKGINDYAPYDRLVREYCESRNIRFEDFPFEKSIHTTVMLEFIYNLKLPLGYIKHHPRGFMSLIDLADDQIVPYIGLTKPELKNWFIDNPAN